MEEFEKKLLSIGGKTVLMPEELPQQICQHGHICDCRVMVPIGGTSRYFLSKEEEVRVMWGFVLDNEGVWKMHSWLFVKRNDIILDNEKYLKYFGFVKEAERN